MEPFLLGGAMSANQNLDDFCAPVNALLDQKHNIFSRTTPNGKPTRGLLTPNEVNDVAQSIIYFPFVSSLFFIL